MKNIFKITMLLVGILTISSLILISNVFSQDNSDYTDMETSFIQELKDKEIRIHYDKDLLYFKDKDQTEYGALLPLISTIKEEFTPKVTLVKDNQLSNDDNVIDIYTQYKMYADNPESFNTFKVYNSTLLVIANKEENIPNVNYGINKNVGFLYNLPEYSKLKDIYKSNVTYDSFDEMIQALKNKEITMAIIPNDEKLNLIDEDSFKIHLTLDTQEKVPLFISNDESSKTFFSVLTKFIKNNGIKEFNDAFFNSMDLYENYYFKTLNADQIKTVKKQYPILKTQIGLKQYPFSFKTNNVYDGTTIRILDGFSEVTGIDYQIYEADNSYISDEEIRNLFNNDEIQIATTLIENNQNKDNFNFSDTVLKSPLVVSLADTNLTFHGDMKIGTLDSIAILIKDFYNFSNLEIYSNLQLMMDDLKLGKLEAIITSETFFDYNNKDELRKLTLHKGETLTSYVNSSFSMSKKTPELNELFNKYLHAYKIFNPLLNNKLDFNYTVINDEFSMKTSNLIFLLVLIIIFIVFLFILVHYINKRYKRKILKLELEYDKNDFDIHPVTGYYSSRMYYEIIKAKVEANEDSYGILTKWHVNNHDTIINKQGISTWNKILIDYKKELDKIIPKNSLKFYLSNGTFACYVDDFKTLEEVHAYIDLTINTPRDITIVDKSLNDVYGSLVIYNHDTDNINNLISYSDYTFNEAKNYKLNKIITFEQSNYSNLLNLSKKIEEFNKILKENSLTAVFQPIFDIEKDILYGFEGLSRTTNKNFSNIMELIEVSQVAKKNFQLSELMKRNVMKDFSQSVYTEKKLFINLDVSNLDGLSSNVSDDMEYISSLNLPKESIVNEITESYKIENYSKLNGICDKFRSDGMLIALDDFGAGYSNTYHVIKLKPDIIKLDRQLISNIDKDTYRQSVVRQQVNLAKELGINILAEGIETKKELIFLKSIGVKYAQGYYLGKPNKLDNFDLKTSLSLLKV